MKIRLARESDLPQIRALLNSKGNQEWLGGKIHDSYIRKSQISVVTFGSKVVGASQYSMEASHRMKMDWVGVDPQYRMRGVASSLYGGWELLALYYGCIVVEDSIVSNNITMPLFLSKRGYVLSVTQRSRVKRHHDLNIYLKDLLYQPSISYVPPGVSVEIEVSRREGTSRYQDTYYQLSNNLTPLEMKILRSNRVVAEDNLVEV